MHSQVTFVPESLVAPDFNAPANVGELDGDDGGGLVSLSEAARLLSSVCPDGLRHLSASYCVYCAAFVALMRLMN